MKPIQKYVKTMEDKDYKALSELFTKDGTLCDYCPNGTEQHEYHIYGKEAINMFFRNKFIFHQYSISQVQIVNDEQAEFIADFGGFNVMAIATVRQTNKKGLIEQLTVRPK